MTFILWKVLVTVSLCFYNSPFGPTDLKSSTFPWLTLNTQYKSTPSTPSNHTYMSSESSVTQEHKSPTPFSRSGYCREPRPFWEEISKGKRTLHQAGTRIRFSFGFTLHIFYDLVLSVQVVRRVTGVRRSVTLEVFRTSPHP